MEQRIFQIALSLLNGIGPVKAKALVNQTGSAEAVFKESLRALSSIHGIGSSVIHSINRKAALERAEREVAFIDRHDIGFYYYEDSNYPYKLRQCEDAPVVLFTKGKIDFQKKSIAIVGTRKATEYGKKLTRELVAQLASFDVNVVSGLAYGIDVEAHRAALHHQVQTTAVLGHGFDLIYPAAHRQVAREMLENGGLITEFATKSNGDTSNFPKRNRVVAGLCDATVVVESAMTGGSLITANMANDYSREVFAFPGNIESEYSRGCNYLIQRNKAHLITCASDLVRILGWEEKSELLTNQVDLFPELSDEEEQIVNVLRNQGETDMDNLGYALEMGVSLLSVNLFNLEMKGLIRSLPGRRYSVH